MPTETFDFDTFSEQGSGVAWTDEVNAESADGNFATAQPTSSTETKLLVATGADFSAIPAGALIIQIRLNIKGKVTGTLPGADIHEVFAWDGSSVQGRNQADDYDKSANNKVIHLTSSNDVHFVGMGGWLWWRPDRLTSSNGVAIRARQTSGIPTVNIDHIQMAIDYIVLRNSFRLIDPRVVAFYRLAGPGEGSEKNECNEEYGPLSENEISWHTDPEDMLNAVIDDRTKHRIKRIVFGTPAGSPDGEISSKQWEPMFDNQRQALIDVISDWLKGDPEREALTFLGTRINDNPGCIEMSDLRVPDVNVADDRAILERTYFPYRDLVGIKRFLLDKASAWDRQKMFDLFEWGRENGMEFLMEAIPLTNEDHDEDFVELYGAWARSTSIQDHDPNFLWDFSKGRQGVQIRSSDHQDISGDEWLAFMADFAREGYNLIPRSAILDPYAMEVASAFAPQRASHSSAISAVRSVTNSAEDLSGNHDTLSNVQTIASYLSG